MAGSENSTDLSRVADLYERGLLTDEEFADAKRGVIPESLYDLHIPAPAAPPPKQRSKTPFLIGLLLLAAAMGFGSLVAPKWGETGYKPQLSQKCREVWASVNVDAPRYIAAACTAEEQREIAGYRPNP